MPVGVDEWVEQSTERRDQGSGWRRWLGALDKRLGWWPRLALAVLAGVVFGQLGVNDNIRTVAVNSLIFVILAVGVNVAAGWAGQWDLGYIAFFGAGAYVYALLSSTALGSGGTGGVHLPAVASIPAAMVVTGMLGLLVGLATLRVSGDYFAIVTLFVGEAFMETVNNVAPGTLGGVNGLFGLDPLHAFGAQVTTVTGVYWVALGCTVVLLAALHLLDHSRTGRAWRAVREDELAATAMTVGVRWVKVLAVTVGAVVGGLAGAIFAAQQSSVFPTNFTQNTLILIYACLVLGGTGTISGAVLGAIVVTAGEQLVSSPTDAGWLFYGLIALALVTRVRPWRRLAAIVVATVLGGWVLRLIVGAISSAAVGGHAGSGGLIGSLVSGWVIVPANADTYGNVLFVALFVMVFLLMRVSDRARVWVLPAAIYLAACCWESRLVVNPAITAQILIGAILIAVMSSRPAGLLGSMRVEVM